MSGRKPLLAPAPEALPGMPAVEEVMPAKAPDGAWKARTLDEAITRTYELLDQTISRYSSARSLVDRGGTIIDYGRYEIAGLFGLYSGGNDSVVLQHLLRKYFRERGLFRQYFGGMIHVNTGTAIEQTTQHVRDTAAAWGWTLHELRPRVTYLDLVLGNVLSTRGPNKGLPVWRGFPGPGGDSHNVMYMRLKDEPLQTFRRSLVGRDGIRRKVIYVGGMRWAESRKRFRTAAEVDLEGAIVWLSALVHWTNEHMREYRARYRCQQRHAHSPHRLCGPEAMPLNEVTEHLHMSGDCACGAFAKKGEKEERRFFYPEHVANGIDEWERIAEAAGIEACRWGERPPSHARQPKGRRRGKERLCAACAPPLEGQTDILDDWRDSGLITAEQHATFTRPAA